MPRDWDAATYDKVADPQARWGRAVVDRLSLEGGERVLDAGCGSGRVTAMLLERLPRGQVVALDGSPSMIAEARRRFAGDGRVEYVVADLGKALPIAAPVDAILSTATFHWVLDHDALFTNLAAALKPGGRLCAQCGGAGNVASVHEAVRALDPALAARAWNKNFATPEDTLRRLERAGFVDAKAWLHPEPTPFESRQALETFLGNVVLGEVLEHVQPERRAAFVRDVAARLPAQAIDYVRLNIEARRG
jgi:trans-aconitate 2-methyltransferase